MRFISSILLSASLCFVTTLAHADTLNVAVASNFSYALNLLSEDFKLKTGHELRISSASTGKLYAQIHHNAPFDVFLSADEKRPDLLVNENKADPSSAYIYALGRLVFISNIPAGDACQNVLTSTALQRLSIANPKTAPYGAAAKQVLAKLRLWSQLQSKLVKAENVVQSLQFVATENAQAGFVAKSVLNIDKENKYACIWDVPADFHSPIRQKLVIMQKTENKIAAQAFLQYMRSANAKTIIKEAGYDVM